MTGVPGVAAEAEEAAEAYERGLGARQVGMIAIGGAIGTGLFLGAGGAIAKAGPSLLAAYAAAGAVVFLVMRALGELLLYRPVPGGFVEYAREFIGPFAGFATGWTYWVGWAVTGMAELTAAGVYAQFWWPGLPRWLTALAVLLLLFAANLVSVRLFGECEFWFSAVKVAAIVAMIVIGVGVLAFGLGPDARTASVSHLWTQGGFAPNGLGQTLLTLQIVVFAFLGVELVGVAAGEARNPERVLPRAVNTIPLRICLFYIGALAVILSLAPWTSFHAGTSPFVTVFETVGIPHAAGAVNAVVLTAALSSCNSGLYSTGRMLRALAARGQAPRRLGALNTRQVPAAGLALSAGVMGIGVVVNALAPDRAFTYITSVATFGGLWTWGVIVVCQMRYRRAADAGLVQASPFRMPGAPWTGRIALGFLAFVTVLLACSADTRVAVYAAVVWALLLGAGYAARGYSGRQGLVGPAAPLVAAEALGSAHADDHQGTA